MESNSISYNILLVYTSNLISKKCEGISSSSLTLVPEIMWRSTRDSMFSAFCLKQTQSGVSSSRFRATRGSTGCNCFSSLQASRVCRYSQFTFKLLGHWVWLSLGSPLCMHNMYVRMLINEQAYSSVPVMVYASGQCVRNAARTFLISLADILLSPPTSAMIVQYFVLKILILLTFWVIWCLKRHIIRIPCRLIGNTVEVSFSYTMKIDCCRRAQCHAWVIHAYHQD